MPRARGHEEGQKKREFKLRQSAGKTTQGPEAVIGTFECFSNLGESYHMFLVRKFSKTRSNSYVENELEVRRVE